MCHILFIHSSVDGHLDCFHVLAVVNIATVNIGVHISFWIMIFSGYMPSLGITGSCGSSYGSSVKFLRNLHTILHSGSINLHSHQQHKRFPFLHTLSSLTDSSQLVFLDHVDTQLVSGTLSSLVVSGTLSSLGSSVPSQLLYDSHPCLLLI